MKKLKWTEYFGKTTVLPKYFRYRYTLLIKALRYSEAGDTLLEIGAGTGWSSISLALAGRRVICLDIDADVISGIKELASNLRVHLSLVCGDMLYLPFREDAFRLAFSQGVLEHFDDQTIISSMREQIRVSPIIIVDVPTEKGRKQKSYGDERWLSWKYWKRLLLKAGAKIDLIYGKSPTLIGFLLPLALYKLLGYRFSMGVGFVCTRRSDPPLQVGIKDRIID